MLTIQHLEVQFDVTGDDKQVFAELVHVAHADVLECVGGVEEELQGQRLGAAAHELDRR